jgi:D-alanyl-lipoteichoic acid acyltransferase DltB (MBOAT superfamily)
LDLIGLPCAAFVAAVALAVALPLPAPAKRALLLAANGAFLWFFDPLAPLLFLATSLVGYGAARLAARGAGAFTLLLTCLPLALPLFLPKLPMFGGAAAVDATGAAAGAAAAAAGDVANVVGARMAMFIGASYITLRALHVVLDARRTRRVHFGLFDFLVYNSFFPTIVAGPIERADHFARSFDRLGRPSAADLRAGVTRLFTGLFKKVVLGGIALQWAAPITGFESGDALSAGQGWLALYAIALYAYFDFAGYSDMALGVGRLMGLRLAENFDNPYLRPSIAEFWRGWHLSLSYWIRDYLFLPMCGRSASALRPHLAAILSMALCGLWHAPNPGWVLWGVAHGAGLSVHQAWTVWLRKRFALKKRLAKSVPVRVVATLLTFHFVALTWVLVSIDPWDLAPAWAYLQRLFGAG